MFKNAKRFRQRRRRGEVEARKLKLAKINKKRDDVEEDESRRASAKGYEAENINLTAKRNIIMNALTTRAEEEAARGASAKRGCLIIKS